MQKIVLDTNVLVSGLINQAGIPGKILHDIVLEGKVHLCISPFVKEEYLDVLNREKFARIPGFKSNAIAVLDFITEYALAFKPTSHFNILRDPDDDYFLDLANEAQADFLVSGNTNDFTIATFGRTKIVTPTDYWENYRP